MKIECILSHGATFPKRGTKESSGMDLVIKGYKAIDINNFIFDEVWFDEESPHDHKGMVPISPGGRILALTGIKMNIPKCEKEGYVYEIQVRPRSGLALKQGITVLNSPGTIDQDYRGDIGVILINHSNNTVVIEDGDRIAQLVINMVTVNEKFEEVKEFNKKTDRGDGGFGSTGD